MRVEIYPMTGGPFGFARDHRSWGTRLILGHGAAQGREAQEADGEEEEAGGLGDWGGGEVDGFVPVFAEVVVEDDVAEGVHKDKALAASCEDVLKRGSDVDVR